MPRQHSKIMFIRQPGGYPEMRQTPAGMPMATFNVAANDQCTNEKGEAIKITAPAPWPISRRQNGTTLDAPPLRSAQTIFTRMS